MSAAMILHALGWALVHGLWQAALIASLVRLALIFTRAPRYRFALAWAGLVASALAFALTLWFELVQLWAVLERAPIIAVTPTRPPLAATIELALPWIVLAWACGVLVFGARAALGFVGVARLRARARAVDAWIVGRCEALAAKLDVRRSVAIAESEGLEVPAVIGWLRPLILLPIGLAARLDAVALEAAIAHELAHVRRRDYLLNVVVTAIEALLFHHPCVWWLAGVARREREHACDELVVARVQSRRSYARALLVLEQARVGAHAAPAPSMAADGAPLLDRIRRLHATPTPTPMPQSQLPQRSLRSPRASLLALVGAAAAVVALGLAAPACVESQDSSDPDSAARIDGTIALDDETAVVDVAWLPESVERHAARIEAAARRHGVDPNLLAIVVLIESGGNPDAESPTGARGLMQLMPETAARIAAERTLADHDGERLWDPDYNLDLGAYFLARQLERWGDVELAAAAYNGGPVAVERWLVDGTPLSEETELYRSKIAELWHSRHAAAPR